LVPARKKEGATLEETSLCKKTGGKDCRQPVMKRPGMSEKTGNRLKYAKVEGKASMQLDSTPSERRGIAWE